MPEVSTPVSSYIFYRKMGAGPALVLLHGFPESGTLWQNTWDDLSRQYTLIIPDFPGSGESTLEKETSISDMAECVNAILDKEGINSAVIAGHSMGGYVAFAFAELYPNKIRGLSLVHSTSEPDDEEKIKIRVKSIELMQRGAKNAFINQMVPNLFSAAFKQSNPLDVKAQIDQALEMDEVSMVNFYKAMMSRADKTNVLKKAVFPVQWIIGADDNIIYFKKILSLCYKSGINFVSFYNNCGHMSMIELPQMFVNDLKLFVDYSYFCSNKS